MTKLPELTNRVFDEEFNKMMKTVEAKTIVLDSLILLSKSSPTDSQYHINDNGFQKIWEMDEEVHRHDGPAVIHRSGTQEWFRHGKRHRDDGPAIEYKGGRLEWYRDGKRHRLDGPAIFDQDSIMMWFIDGIAPACVETIWEGQIAFIIQPEWPTLFDIDHLPSAKHIGGYHNWCKIYTLDEVDANLLKLSMKVTSLL